MKTLFPRKAFFVLIIMIPAYILITAFGSITVMPAYITPQDSVQISYSYLTTTSPTVIFNRQVALSGFSVQLDVCAGTGEQTMGVTLHDTAHIGLLPPGFYTARLYGYNTHLSDTFCSVAYWYDSAVVSFQVHEPNSVAGREYGQELRLLTNPAGSTLVAKLNRQIMPHAMLEVINLSGHTLVTKQNFGGETVEINVEALPAGVYFLKLSDGQRGIVKRFVKVN